MPTFHSRSSRRLLARLLPLSIFAIGFGTVSSDRLQGQGKEKPKDAPPQIVVPLQMAADPGKTTKLTIRGVRIDNITEVRIQEPKSTGKVIGKGKKVGVPNQMTADQVGDSEIDIEVTLPLEVAGGYVPFTVVGPGGESKPGRFLVNDDTPRILEKEPNDGFKQAQPIQLPCLIDGSIKQNQDVDVFRWEGKAGDRVTADVQANRFGSPVDGMLTLYDAEGRVLATADDTDGHLDPILKFTLPHDGTYYLALIDGHDQGGTPFVYRLGVRTTKE